MTQLSNLLPFSNSSDILVCETDGFSLRGAVIKKAGHHVEVVHSVQSQLADMAEALKEIADQLAAKGWKKGKAVLLSPAVLSTMVELPVDPKKPRSLAQMQELIRWEVEPLLMQHTTQWTVGHLLVGQGYMSAEQAQTVMDMQQGKVNPTGELDLTDKLSLRRFGDLAVELKYIRRSQLNACLAGQEWLKSDDETIECGWAAQGEVADVPGTFGWLVSCVNQALLTRWKEVFAKYNIQLQAMYPLTGCSTSLSKSTQDARTIIESHHNMAFVTRIVNENVVSQYQYVNPEKSALEICLETYHALNIAASETVELACWHDDARLLVDELQHALAEDVNLLSTQFNIQGVSLGMVGAAYHAFKLSGSEFCTDVRLGGPLPPFWHRPASQLSAVAVLLVLVVVASEVTFMVMKNQVLAEKSLVDAEWQQIDASIKKVKSKQKQIETRKKELADQQVEQIRLQALLSFYSNDIPERTALVQGVLGALQTDVGDDVVITRIDEAGKRATLHPRPSTLKNDKRVEVENFNLEAWALSETAAQNFIQQIKRTVASLGLEVRDPQVIARLGPLNLDGFAVAVRLVKFAAKTEGDNSKVAMR
jgi:hypothetical protein